MLFEMFAELLMGFLREIFFHVDDHQIYLYTGVQVRQMFVIVDTISIPSLLFLHDDCLENPSDLFAILEIALADLMKEDKAAWLLLEKWLQLALVNSFGGFQDGVSFDTLVVSQFDVLRSIGDNLFAFLDFSDGYGDGLF